jgi:hypothetical protein
MVNDNVLVTLELNENIYDEFKSVLADVNKVRAANDCVCEYPVEMVVEMALLNETAKLRKALNDNEIEVL